MGLVVLLQMGPQDADQLRLQLGYEIAGLVLTDFLVFS